MTLSDALMTETELVARELGDLMMRANDLMGITAYLEVQERAVSIAEKSGGLVDGTLTLAGMRTVRRVLATEILAAVAAVAR